MTLNTPYKVLIYRIFIGYFLCNIVNIQLIAQDLGDEGHGGHQHEEINDTIFYSNYQLKAKEDRITDTLLNGNFFRFDEVEKQWPYVGQLGYSGSPRITNDYFLPKSADWNINHSPFQPYQKSWEDLLFIQKGLPITKVTYVQTPQVNQSIFNGFFGRKFNDLSFSMDHQRYNFTGDYDNQQSFNTIFHTGGVIDKPKWRGYILFASEVFQQNNNGGILSDSLYGNENYQNRIALTTALDQGRSRDDTKKGNIGWLYKALSIDKYEGSIGGGVTLSKQIWTVSSGTSNDTTGYFPLLEATQNGINAYVEKNSFFPHILIELADTSRALFTLASKTGLNFNKINFHHSKQNWQAIVQQGHIQFQTKGFLVDADLDLQLFDQDIFFVLNGQIAGNWRGFGVSGFGLLSRSTAPWLYHQYTVSGTKLWNLSPNSMFTQQLGGEISYRNGDFLAKFKLKQTFQDNVSYFDNDGQPALLNQQISLSMMPSLAFKLGILHVRNYIAYQINDHNILGIPDWSGQHEVFIEDRWFKNRMHINLGFTAYWKSAHDAAYYLPYLQSFISTPHRLENEYRIDPFFTFRVKSFKFFARFENLHLTWNKDQPSYDVYHYPLFDPTMRLGLQWIFRN